jgi:hypothetical protein
MPALPRKCRFQRLKVLTLLSFVRTGFVVPRAFRGGFLPHPECFFGHPGFAVACFRGSVAFGDRLRRPPPADAKDGNGRLSRQHPCWHANR